MAAPDFFVHWKRTQNSFIHELANAVRAHVFTLKIDDIFGIIAENTGRLVLFRTMEAPST